MDADTRHELDDWMKQVAKHSRAIDRCNDRIGGERENVVAEQKAIKELNLKINAALTRLEIQATAEEMKA